MSDYPVHQDEELPWSSLAEMLSERARHFPDQLALIDGELRLTHAELAAGAMAVAAGFHDLGVRPGDRIGIWSANGWRWLVTAMACWHAGAVLVPLSARLKPLEILPLLRASEPKVLVAPAGPDELLTSLIDHIDAEGVALSAALPALETLVVAGEPDSPIECAVPWESLLEDPGTEASTSSLASRPDDLALIMFSSGTTGVPKGVMLNHGQILQGVWNVTRMRGWQSTDRQLLLAPLSHVTGLYFGLITAVMSGSGLVIMPSFKAGPALELMSREGVNCLAGPPGLFEQLLRESRLEGRPSLKLRMAIIAGAPASAELIRELADTGAAAQVFTGYAMTECVCIAGTRSDSSREIVSSSVGWPVGSLRVRVANETNRELPRGETGEIQVSGFAVMQAYLGEAPGSGSAFSADGWLKTGDLGRFSEDGSLQIRGRRKDMYIAYGYNVYPAEVESLLMQSGLLAEVAVVARPNKFSGEEGIAFAVLKPGSDLEGKALLSWARKNMAPYKVPARVHIRSGLPLTSNGKVDKQTLLADLQTDSRS